MTRCQKGKRRLILASIAISGLFAGGALTESSVFAEELTSEAGETVSSGTEDAGDVKDDADAENADTENADSENADSENADEDNADAEDEAEAPSTDGVKAYAAEADVNPAEEATETSITEDSVKEDIVTEDIVTEDIVTEDTVTEDTVTEDTAAEEESSSRPQFASAEEIRNGWATEGDYTYYYVDGEKVTNTIMEIDGACYGFTSDGRLRKNSYFSMYDVEDRIYYSYRAGSDGKLYRGTWYETKVYVSSGGVESRKYYYDEYCRGARGIYEVDGKNYLFNSSGLLMIGKSSTVDGQTYAGTNDGYPKKLKDNGWDQAGGSWFYLQDGQAVYSKVKEIDGDLYAFDSYGAMVNNDKIYSTSYYDEQGEFKSGTCRAKKGGKLYRNEWFYSENEERWYYYGSDGMGLSGYRKVGNKYYYFNSEGCMLTDTVYTGNEGDLTYTYIIDEDGLATRLKQNGWSKVGDKYYYTTNGKTFSNEVVTIDGKQYGFSFTGMMFDDTSFVISNYDEEGKWDPSYYRAKAGGELYRLSWFHEAEYDIWCYYGSDGKAVTGVRTIAKKTYCFDTDGEMYRNTSVTIGGKTYLCLDSGLAKEMPEKQWTIFNGKWYYNGGSGLVKNNVTNIDGKNYGFDSDGALIMDRRFRLNSRYYRADKDGVVLTNQWYGYEYYDGSGYTLDGYKEVNGKAYYFIRGVAQKELYYSDGENLYQAGSNAVLKKVTTDGVYYAGTEREKIYLVEGGKLVTDQGWRKIGGEWYYTSEKGSPVRRSFKEIDGKSYYFHADGTMAKGGWVRTEQSSYNNYTMYAKANGELLTGDQTINGKKYHFDPSGIMCTGITTIDGEPRLYGPDGVYIGLAKGDGWNEIDGKWYYLQNGYALTGSNRTIGKYTYCFNSSGMLRTDFRDISSRYIYDRNGRHVTGGWYQDGSGNWYYVDPETGEYVYSEELTIGKKTYYFDYYGVMRTEDVVTYEDGKGHLIKTAADGSFTKTEFTSDWVLSRGTYYYKESKTGWVGDYYLYYGEPYGPRITPEGYLVDFSGKKVTKTGWLNYTIDYEGYYEATYSWYVKKDQKGACSEWVKDNGTWYYFDDQGMLRKYSFMDGQTLYLIDDQGKMVRQVDHAEDGWYAVGNSWIFVQGGEIVSDRLFQENDDRYYMQYEGPLTTNGVAGYDTGFVFGADGKADVKNTGWKEVDGRWYYTRKNGVVYYGWNDVNGKLYYIPSTGMVTGYNLIDGVMYQFGKNGALIGMAPYAEGWQKLGGDWYYAANGDYYYGGIRTINGKEYVFDSNGKMLVGKEAMIMGCYTDSNGVLLKNTWKKIDGSWYYFTSTGRFAYGYEKINGKVYYFGFDGKMKE